MWNRLRHLFWPGRHNRYHPQVFSRGGLVAFLAVALATEGFLVAVVVAQQSGGSFLAAVEQGALISLTNTERADNNLGGLTENKVLDAAAQQKADDMAAKSYFSHQSPDGRQAWDFMAAAGYDYEYAGENLAVRFVDSNDVVQAWMTSPSHRANILKPQYKDIGIGIAQGTYQGERVTYVVQFFGATADEVANTDALQVDSAKPVVANFQAGLVEGASIVAQKVPNANSALRSLSDIAGSPRAAALAILTILAVLIFAGVGITLVAHAHARRAPKVLLVGVIVVGIVSLSFIALDSNLFVKDVTVDTQAASVEYGAGSIGIFGVWHASTSIPAK